MKVLLILPDGRIHKISIGSFVRSMREAPLTLTTLAALAPPELDIEFKLVDESVEKISPDETADLIGISLLTGTSTRGYALSAHFRKRGIPVVLGGVHVTLMSEEAAKHADSVVIGLAEHAWPQLLRDFSKGMMQPIYRGARAAEQSIEYLPAPRRDLQRSLRYMMPNTIMATRGCKGSCAFCTIPALLDGYAKRPVAAVIDEIKQCRGRYVVFNDVSMADDVDYAKELFTAMIPLRKRWGGLTTVKAARDAELVDLMARSGCKYILVGFESIHQPSLGEIRKGFNREEEYRHFMEIMHAHGISIQGCFIFGFDHDGPEIFEETMQRVIELKVDIPRYAIMTPYPGTELFERLEAERRILSYRWEEYDTTHVVFRPARMSSEELYRGYVRAYRETFKLPRIVKRLASLGFSTVVNFVGNLNYRRFANNLQRRLVRN